MVIRRKKCSFLNSPSRNPIDKVSREITGRTSAPKIKFIDSFPPDERYPVISGLSPKRVHVLQLRVPERNGKSDEMYEGNKTMELIRLEGKISRAGITAVPGTLHNQCLEFWFGRDLPRLNLIGPSVERRVYDVVFIAYETRTSKKGKLLSVGERNFRHDGRRYG